MFKIATWNVNSIRVRLEQVLGWLVVLSGGVRGREDLQRLALLSKPGSSLRDSAVSR